MMSFNKVKRGLRTRQKIVKWIIPPLAQLMRSNGSATNLAGCATMTYRVMSLFVNTELFSG